jgi:DNA-binding transcriptional LysR family regulator
MNWDDLQLFQAAANMRGISAAARTLGLSQPQLSRRLRRFEDQMGTRLFDRTPSGLMLTPAGERLLPLAAEMKKVADGVKRVQPELASKSRRVVRISLDEVRQQFVLRHALFLKQAIPHADIELYSAHLHLDHATRETDIQIRSCLPESDTLVAKRLGELSYAVYRSRNYTGTARVCPADDANWVGLSADRVWYPEIAQWMETHVRHPAKLRVNTMTGMEQALSAGAGYGVLPCFMAENNADLVRVGDFGIVKTSQENLIIHRDLLRDETIRKAVDAICLLYKQKPADVAA